MGRGPLPHVSLRGHPAALFGHVLTAPRCRGGPLAWVGTGRRSKFRHQRASRVVVFLMGHLYGNPPFWSPPCIPLNLRFIVMWPANAEGFPSILPLPFPPHPTGPHPGRGLVAPPPPGRPPSLPSAIALPRPQTPLPPFPVPTCPSAAGSPRGPLRRDGAGGSRGRPRRCIGSPPGPGTTHACAWKESGQQRASAAVSGAFGQTPDGPQALRPNGWPAAERPTRRCGLWSTPTLTDEPR